MEFQILKVEQPSISVNIEEVKGALAEKLQEYNGIVVTEETLAGCKRAQKELASLRTEVDNNRKKIKKELTAPISEFEDKCKELIAMIEAVEAPLKDGIKVYDDQRREEKRKIALKIMEEEAGNAGLNQKYATRLELREKYMNLTATEAEVRDDVIAQTLALKVQQEAENDRIKIITDAIERENTRIHQKIDISFFKYNIESGQSTSEILAEISHRAELIYAAENAPQELPKPEKVETPIETNEAQEKPAEAPQKLYSVTFTLTGSADEMRKVSTFLKSNGIAYQVIEQKVIE